MPISALVAMGLLAVFLLRRGQRAEAEREQGDPDQATLDELARAGSRLDRPHEMEFFLYLPTEVGASRVATTLQDDGFETRIEPPEAGSAWLCVATRWMVPDRRELWRLRDLFTGLAEAGDGVYDGWGATVEGDDRPPA